MFRYFILTIIIALPSCSLKNKGELPDWILENSELIEHTEISNQKIQIVYSTLNIGDLRILDTSIVVQTFRDTLLFEEINYNIKNGDSIKWSRHINEYNANGLVINEIDSVNGLLRFQSMNFYKNRKIQRSEIMTNFPNYNDSIEMINSDTMRSTFISFYNYNTLGKCNMMMAVNKDELSFKLTGSTKYDTTLTFNQFDEQSNQIGSVTLINGDTTSMSRAEFDNFGRKTSFITADMEFGATTFRYEYDEQGNKTSELFISDDFKNLILTKYDRLNRPIIRKKYRSKTPANISQNN